MHVSMRKQRRAARRPGALPNLRRISQAIKPVPRPRPRKKGYGLRAYAVDVLVGRLIEFLCAMWYEDDSNTNHARRHVVVMAILAVVRRTCTRLA